MHIYAVNDPTSHLEIVTELIDPVYAINFFQRDNQANSQTLPRSLFESLLDGEGDTPIARLVLFAPRISFFQNFANMLNVIPFSVVLARCFFVGQHSLKILTVVVDRENGLILFDDFLSVRVGCLLLLFANAPE